MTSIGARIEEAREWCDWNQRELAVALHERAGMKKFTKGTISRWENNKTINVKQVIAICRVTDANPYWLLTGDGPERWSAARRTGGVTDARYLAREVRKTIQRVMGEVEGDELPELRPNGTGGSPDTDEDGGGDGSE